MRPLTPTQHLAIIIAILFLAVQIGFSQATYTSVRDGAWNDPGTWSLHGVDPCDCTPSATISGFEVMINHNVSADFDIEIESAGLLTIAIPGSFSMSENTLEVVNGSFISDGFSHLGAFEVATAGYGLFTFPTIIENDIVIRGVLDVLFAEYDSIVIINGDMDIKESGVLNMELACLTFQDGDFASYGESNLDNSALCMMTGDISNAGTMLVSNNTCFTLFEGDLDNSGYFEGVGAVNLMDGDIENMAGTWVDIAWCARDGHGVPMPMECEAVDSICALTGEAGPLSIRNLDMAVERAKGGVLVTWQVSYAENIVRYNVERASEDKGFMLIASVEIEGRSLPPNQYSYMDSSPVDGINYYRIGAVETSGNVYYSAIRSINYSDYSDVELTVYPNPTCNEEVFIMINGLAKTVTGTLVVYLPDGREIDSRVYEMEPGVPISVDVNNHIPGAWIIRFRTATHDFSKIIIVEENPLNY